MSVKLGDVVTYLGGRLMVVVQLSTVYKPKAKHLARCSWRDAKGMRDEANFEIRDLTVVPESDRKGHLRIVRCQ